MITNRIKRGGSGTLPNGAQGEPLFTTDTYDLYIGKGDGTNQRFQKYLTNPVTGTGTTNYLSKFTAASTIGNSLIYDNGTNVIIGSTTPSLTYTSEKLALVSNSNTYLEIRGTTQASLVLTKQTQAAANKPDVEIFNSGNFGIVIYNPTIVSSNYLMYYAADSLSNRSLSFQTEGSNRLTLNQDGTIRLNAYTTNGFVKTTNSDGTLSIDTSVITGSGTANQVTYFTGTNAIAGSTFLTLNLTADNGYLILTGGATYKNADIWLNRLSNSWENAIRFQTNSVTDWYVGSSATGANNDFEIYNYGTSTNGIKIAKATNNVTLTGALSGTSATFTGDLTVDTNTLYVDSTNDRVGIQSNSPNYVLQIGGISIGGGTVSNFNGIALRSGGYLNTTQRAGFLIQAGIGDNTSNTIWMQHVIRDGSGGALAPSSLVFSQVSQANPPVETERVRFHHNGYVGIGSSSPTAKLTISGTSAAAAIDWTNTTATTGRTFRWVSLNAGGFAIEDITASATRFTISSTGTATFNGDLIVDTNTLYVNSTTNRVGISNLSPSYKLDLTSLGYGIQHYGDANNYLRTYAGSNFQIIESNGTNQFGYNNGSFFIQTSSTNRLTIASGGSSTFSSSITAATAIARGVNITSTLVAAANNDVLVGLDIAPTFTNGAFTGVSNIALRVNDLLTGTTANFNGFGINSNPTSLGTSQSFVRFLNTGGDFYVGLESSTNGGFFTGSTAYDSVIFSSTPFNVILSNTSRLRITTTGATFSVPISGTSATFSSDVATTAGFFNFQNNYGIQGRNAANSAYRIVLKLNASNQIEIGRDSDIAGIILGTASATNALSIASTGAATFSSTISLADDFTLNSANPQIKWASGNLRFTSVAGGADRMVLTSAGAATFSSSVTATSETTSSSLVQQWLYSGNSNYKLQLNTIVSAGLVKYSFDLTNNSTAYSNNLVLDRGNVGISTTNPLNKLHIDGSSGIRISDATGTNFRGITFGATAADAAEYSYIKWQASTGEMRIYANTAGFGGFMSFYSNNAEAMRINSTGELLINSISDAGAYKLQVTGDSYFTNSAATGANIILKATGASASAQLQLIGGSQTNPYYIYTDSTRNLIFQDNATERMRLTANGQINYSPLSPYVTSTTVAGTTNLTPTLNTSDTYIFIGTAASAYTLTLNNPTGTPTQGQKMIMRFKDNGTQIMSLSWGTQYRASSDLALPTATTAGKTLYLGFIYNSTDTKWDLIARLNNF